MLRKGVVVSNGVKLVLARKDGSPGDLDGKAEEKLNALVDPNIEELRGLLGRWKEMSATRVYAVISLVTNEPIGLVAWTGPNYMADPSWWTHSTYRVLSFWKFLDKCPGKGNEAVWCHRA